ncbi:MAG TPA: ABC transporter ATP-binding protein [Verrucomicrobiae bacterium]|nr:ABC transporter ATP-binding protein [Verrucomicrobiae bacterium]
MRLLEIKDLRLDILSGGRRLTALDGVSLDVQEAETVCLVGESGSGKTLTALSVTRLLAPEAVRFPQGEVLLDGHDVLKMTEAELRSVRGGKVSYVFQEPGASLNPVFRIGAQIKEALKLHQPRSATDAEVVRLLGLVGIASPEIRMRDYPFRLSGGMQQRVMLAMALATAPRLLIADEPTTALDVTIQAQILELLRDLKKRAGMALLLITHNLGIVGGMADRVAVMYAGQIVELAPAADLMREPLHPYTRALIASVPRLGAETHRLASIPGVVPRPGEFPSGCRFHPRCPSARAECANQIPALRQIEPGRWVRCAFAEDLRGREGRGL